MPAPCWLLAEKMQQRPAGVVVVMHLLHQPGEAVVVVRPLQQPAGLVLVVVHLLQQPAGVAVHVCRLWQPLAKAQLLARQGLVGAAARVAVGRGVGTARLVHVAKEGAEGMMTRRIGGVDERRKRKARGLTLAMLAEERVAGSQAAVRTRVWVTVH